MRSQAAEWVRIYRERWSRPSLAYGFEVDVETHLHEVLQLNRRWRQSPTATGGFDTAFPIDGLGSLLVVSARRSRIVIADRAFALSPDGIQTLLAPPDPARDGTRALRLRQQLPPAWAAQVPQRPDLSYWVLSGNQSPARIVVSVVLDEDDPGLERLRVAGAECLSPIERGVEVLSLKGHVSAVSVPLREIVTRAVARLRRVGRTPDARFQVHLVGYRADSGIQERERLE